MKLLFSAFLAVFLPAAGFAATICETKVTAGGLIACGDNIVSLIYSDGHAALLHDGAVRCWLADYEATVHLSSGRGFAYFDHDALVADKRDFATGRVVGEDVLGTVVRKGDIVTVEFVSDFGEPLNQPLELKCRSLDSPADGKALPVNSPSQSAAEAG